MDSKHSLWCSSLNPKNIMKRKVGSPTFAMSYRHWTCLWSLDALPSYICAMFFQVIASLWERTTCFGSTTQNRPELRGRKRRQLKPPSSRWIGPSLRESFWRSRASTWSRRWRKGTPSILFAISTHTSNSAVVWFVMRWPVYHKLCDGFHNILCLFM